MQQRVAYSYVKSMKEPNLKRPINVWETTVGFPIMQTFPLHIVCHLPKYNTHFSAYGQAKTCQLICGTLVVISY